MLLKKKNYVSTQELAPFKAPSGKATARRVSRFSPLDLSLSREGLLYLAAENALGHLLGGAYLTIPFAHC